MVPLMIPAIVVDHAMLLDPMHGHRLPGAEADAERRGVHRAAARRGKSGAPMDDKPRKARNERLIAVVGLVFAVISCPG